MARPPYGNGDPRVQELMTEVAVLKTLLGERDKALGLQAEEYERRLDVLNHAHEEARQVAADKAVEFQKLIQNYVTNDVHGRDMGPVMKDIAELKSWKDKIAGGGSALDYFGRAAWAVFGGIFGAALMYFLKGGLQ